MIEFYLWLNAAIYFAFAIWCILQRNKTANSSGYLYLNNSGWSEYLVIYGGLQIGLGLFYIYLALNPIFYHLGLVFSMLIYIPIVFFRGVTIYKFRPVTRVTISVGFMELLLLGGAIFLLLVIKSIT